MHHTLDVGKIVSTENNFKEVILDIHHTLKQSAFSLFKLVSDLQK